jgi:hypothetical protein
MYFDFPNEPDASVFRATELDSCESNMQTLRTALYNVVTCDRNM